MGICNGAHTSVASIAAAMAQPTILDECKSSTAAKYSQPYLSDVSDIADPDYIGQSLLELPVEHIG